MLVCRRQQEGGEWELGLWLVRLGGRGQRERFLAWVGGQTPGGGWGLRGGLWGCGAFRTGVEEAIAKGEYVDFGRFPILTTFWNQFQTIVHNNDDLDTRTTLAYLRVSIKDPHTHVLLCSGAETDEHYDEVIAILHKRFDQKRIVHCTYTRNLFEWTPIARESREELRVIRDSLATNIRGLKNTKQWDASSLATSRVV